MKINKNSKIEEVFENHPETVSVFDKYELGCLGCSAAKMETIKDISLVHGIDIDSFIKDLNEAIKNE